MSIEEKYGAIGTVIGHEISHAFDSTGSKFDEKGQIKEWWTEEDRANYKKLSQKIIDYYAKYEYMGFKVDGEKTLGENIADLGGMKVIVAIAESKGATNEDFKNMFEAFASADATKMNKESAEAQILGDEHAPNQVRINGVLSSTDKFYEVYDIKEGDKMYVPKEERVSLW
jgi:putative endopeptidase